MLPLCNDNINYARLLCSDIDDCIDLPCANGGTCIDLVDDYSCSCVAGLEGKNCTTGKEKIILFGLYVYFYIFISIASLLHS